MADTLRIELPAPDAEMAYEIGIEVLQGIQQNLSGSRSGRWYPLPGNIAYEKITPKGYRAKNYHVKFTGASRREQIVGSAYQASAPGEPPATRTGRLRQSFFMTIDPKEGGTFAAVIRTNVHYADDLEYGTEKISPRPFARPAIEAAHRKLGKKIDNWLYRIFRNE